MIFINAHYHNVKCLLVTGGQLCRYASHPLGRYCIADATGSINHIVIYIMRPLLFIHVPHYNDVTPT